MCVEIVVEMCPQILCKSHPKIGIECSTLNSRYTKILPNRSHLGNKRPAATFIRVRSRSRVTSGPGAGESLVS